VTELFRSKITELISLNREGKYWDFKETHHNNKAELLHDIGGGSIKFFKQSLWKTFVLAAPDRLWRKPTVEIRVSLMI
jgi:hypothetical protein